MAPPHREDNCLKQTTLNNVLLYPERRKKPTDSTSPYFTKPLSNLTELRNDLPEADDEAKPKANPPDPRQTTLSFKDGKLKSSSSSPKSHSPSDTPHRRQTLVQTASETKSLLPGILSLLPSAPPKGYLYNGSPGHPPHLDPKYSPKFPHTPISIINADTFDAAIALHTNTESTTKDRKHVCVLNMANARSAGGGWIHGALAQEEALCYRSSLIFSLKLRYYPLPECGGIYSPFVVVIRENLQQGHKLLDLTRPNDLPVVSCVSIAAINGPAVTKDNPPKYKRPRDRDLMKEKMRVTLRIGAFNGHRRLVLGALGCGAFLNPREEVADCWAEVLQEREFACGWWESVVFAVLDDGGGKDGSGNFGTFYRRLGGLKV